VTSTRPGEAPTVPTALRSALAERYQIERELGHGGMAIVYLARDLKHDRPVAVKILRAELASSVGSERFLREIAIAAQLQHPNILTLIDSGEGVDPGTRERFVYYVMPYVQGESLRDRLARTGPMSPAEAIPLLHDVVEAVASAHRHGVVHRDIKPDNVLLAENHALVVDFGVAKAMSDARQETRLTATGMSLGTPAYMAPEQAAGDPNVDHRADVYAIGIVAYEMLAGRPPFTGTLQAILTAQMTAAPKPLPVRDRGIPPELDRIVMRCLEKDPDARYQSTDELLTSLDSIRSPARSNRRALVTAVVAATAVIAVFVGFGLRARRVSWVRGTAIPTIDRLVEKGDYDSAFAIAVQAAAVSPRDSILASRWSRFSRTLSFVTDPPGATVYRARFDDTTRWEALGQTPLDSARVPFTVDRYRIVKAGFRPVLLLSGGIDFVVSPPLPPRFILDSAAAPDADMVRVPGGTLNGELSGLGAVPPVALGDFHIGRHEVTNREYKRFVDAGAYSKPDLWRDEDFVKDGRHLAWSDAIALFLDGTGRPGPATWEAGDIPRGQEDLPVGGLSWYEADAYARFVGKSLPTLYHWVRAAGPSAAAYVGPGSNFDPGGPVRGNTFRAMSPFGVFDVAGNVREWCFNADAEGKHYILGGGWSDPSYVFTDAYADFPFDRSPTNGVRVASYEANEPRLAAAQAPIARYVRDYRKEKPVGDAIFATYLHMYDYDRTPLNAHIDTRDTTADDWIRERVSFDAAYGNERESLVLYLPRHAKPPYQTVVVFPPGDATHLKKFSDMYAQLQDFIIKSGRAFAVPIYKSTFERSDERIDNTPDSTSSYRDHVLMWGKDLRRAVDYLATRPDIDSTRLAYDGTSWGGRMGGIMLAIEPRFKAAVLNNAGLKMAPSRPEVDPLHFLPHIKTPVLLLGGKYDHLFPVETAQKPFFSLLGTPEDQKKYLLFEGGHFVPRTELIAESLAWFDKYLGPTSR
jgi:hypothetical protein